MLQESQKAATCSGGKEAGAVAEPIRPCFVWDGAELIARHLDGQAGGARQGVSLGKHRRYGVESVFVICWQAAASCGTG